MGTSGLIAAYHLDGKGGGLEIGWDEVRDWTPSSGLIWVHLDFSDPDAAAWLVGQAGLDPTIAQALLAGESRPRSVVSRGGLLVILRAANLNEGADADDMVALKVWLEGNRIITTRRRALRTIDSMRSALEDGRGPTSPGDYLARVCDGLTERVGDALSDLEDRVDALEDAVLTEQSYDLRARIADFRRTAIRFRRYLAPQKDTLTRLHGERVEWLTELERAQLREVGDRALRMVEDLDSARDRAAVAQDELNSKLSEQMNQTMYILSIVTGIFLPLGLLTGLLGINVGGMPGVDSDSAFLVVCGALLVMAFALTVVFRRRGWI